MSVVQRWLDSNAIVLMGSKQFSNKDSEELHIDGCENAVRNKYLSVEVVNGHGSSVHTKDGIHYCKADQNGGSFIVNGVEVNIRDDGICEMKCGKEVKVNLLAYEDPETLLFIEVNNQKFHFSKKNLDLERYKKAQKEYRSDCFKETCDSIKKSFADNTIKELKEEDTGKLE
jgi:hypothetical protein